MPGNLDSLVAISPASSNNGSLATLQRRKAPESDICRDGRTSVAPRETALHPGSIVPDLRTSSPFHPPPGRATITAPRKVESRNKVLDSLFEQDDYRAFLRDFFEEERRIHPRFSLRALALKAGFRSSGFWSLILSRARNLGEGSIEPVVNALGLVGRPAAFLAALIRHNQARTSEERQSTLLELKRLRKAHGFARTSVRQFPYWEDWRLVALRELAVHADWNGDFARLGRLLRPACSADKARHGLEKLVDLGFLRRSHAGTWEQTDPVVTAEGAPPVLLREFKKEMLLRGMEAVESLPPTRRHSSTVTLAMSQASLRTFARRIDELRADMLRTAMEEQPEVVLQANFQIFPLSEPFGPSSKGDGSSATGNAEMDNSSRSGIFPDLVRAPRRHIDPSPTGELPNPLA